MESKNFFFMARLFWMDFFPFWHGHHLHQTADMVDPSARYRPCQDYIVNEYVSQPEFEDILMICRESYQSHHFFWWATKVADWINIFWMLSSLGVNT